MTSLFYYHCQDVCLGITAILVVALVISSPICPINWATTFYPPFLIVALFISGHALIQGSLPRYNRGALGGVGADARQGSDHSTPTYPI